MEQASVQNGESFVTKPAGDYYLSVNASGAWTVVVEEKK
jgi:hypothetical protein